jgi:cullin 3
MSYQLVLHKHGDMLYEGVVETIRAHLTGRAESLRGVPDDTLLQRVKEVWEAHGREMSLVRDILMYMDKTFCSLQKKTPVYAMGVLQFRDRVVRHATIKARLQHALLDNIRRERDG